MRRNVLGLGGTVAALIVAAALGQHTLAQTGQLGASIPAPGITQPAPGAPSVTGQAPGPSFHIMGWPVTVSAPVVRPYSNSAYRDFAGQPQGSGDAVLNWRRDGD